jgi:hypothetical protein
LDSGVTDATNTPLSPMEALVAHAMAKNGKQIDLAEIHRHTAMSQDAGIDGIDVWDFVVDLGEEHRDIWGKVPWGRFSDQRASFYGCNVLLFPVWLLARIVTWPVHRDWPIPPPRPVEERLTVAHLAAVLERGEWFEDWTQA